LFPIIATFRWLLQLQSQRFRSCYYATARLHELRRASWRRRPERAQEHRAALAPRVFVRSYCDIDIRQRSVRSSDALVSR
jgi:hypothetical protein